MEPDKRVAELVIGLAGSTYSDLKKIDNGITSQTGNLRPVSENIKKTLSDFVQGVKPLAARLDPVANIPVPGAMQPQGPLVPQPQIQQEVPLAVIPNPPTQVVQAPQLSPGQLEFDFDRKARYQDIVDKLTELETKVDTILSMMTAISRKSEQSNAKKN